MKYDESLKEIGEFGAYQRRVYFLVCLVAIPCIFNNLGYVFWTARLDHWCKVDKPIGLSNISEDVWKEMSIPLKEGNTSDQFESCLQYNLEGINFTSFMPDYLGDSWNVTNYQSELRSKRKGPLIPCTEWSYDTSQYKSSIVSMYDLVCDRQWLISTSQSAFMACRIGGTLGLGAFSDRFGRRKTIVVSLFLEVLSSMLIAFAPNVLIFILMRCVCAVFSEGTFQTVYVLVMEIVGPTWRVFTGTGIMVYWALGYMLLAVLAYFIRQHFVLQLVLSCPCITLLLVCWVIPESPRWLLAKGRKDEAMTIIRKMAEVNKRSLSEEFDLTLSEEKKVEVEEVSWVASIRSQYLWRMSVVLFIIWFTNSVVYFGISMNTSNLAGNDYFNFFISGAVEIPAYVLCYVTLVKFGRQMPLLIVMVLAGVSLLATGFIPTDYHLVTVTLAMVGKLSITCSFSMIYIFTAELYPTTVRSVAIGVCSTMSRIGGILAPFTTELGQFYPGLPLIVFGVMSTASGLTVATLPETKNRTLPQTIREGEALARQSNLITRFCKKSRSESRTQDVDCSS